MSIAVLYCSWNTEWNDLTGTIPSEMGLLKSLTSLDLSKQCRFCVWYSRSETMGGVLHDAFRGGSCLDSTSLTRNQLNVHCSFVLPLFLEHSEECSDWHRPQRDQAAPRIAVSTFEG